MHLRCHKYLDLHWTLTVSVQYQIDLFPRLYVEVFSHSRGITQVFIVDYNSIEMLRKFLCIHKIKKIKQDLNLKKTRLR